jgi:hypothetical protein
MEWNQAKGGVKDILILPVHQAFTRNFRMPVMLCMQFRVTGDRRGMRGSVQQFDLLLVSQICHFGKRPGPIIGLHREPAMPDLHVLFGGLLRQGVS